MHSRHLVKLLGLALLAVVSLLAMSASAAQAKLLLLLNGKSVDSLARLVDGLKFYLKAENGLKIECTKGSGTGKVTAVESGKKVTSTWSTTMEGCVWVGSEKTCTINDGGAGLMKWSGSGEVVMPDANTYVETSTSAEFSTILTEGAFCTIPEEEVISGTIGRTMLDALKDETIKLSHLKAENLKLGNSKVTECVWEQHSRDSADPNATIALHLVNL